MGIGDVTKWIASIFLAVAIVIVVMVLGAVIGHVALSPFVTP